MQDLHHRAERESLYKDSLPPFLGLFITEVACNKLSLNGEGEPESFSCHFQALAEANSRGPHHPRSCAEGHGSVTWYWLRWVPYGTFCSLPTTEPRHHAGQYMNILTGQVFHIPRHDRGHTWRRSLFKLTNLELVRYVNPLDGLYIATNILV